MNKKYKTLLSNMSLFFLASFVPKTISFFMIPLYTYCLTTIDYGTADLLSNTVQLLVPVLTLQIQDAVLRYTMEADKNKKDVFSVGIRFTLRGGTILIVCMAVAQALGLYTMSIAFWGYMFVNYFTTSLNSVFSYFCRGIGKIKILTVSSIVLSLVTIILNILLLVNFKMGLYGYLLANSVGAVIGIIIIYCGAQLYKYSSFSFTIDKKLQKEMTLFSIPMIFSALSWWVNNASDRYILTFFSGVSAVGLYAVSSKIPTILSTLGSVISRAFSVSAIQELDKDDSDGFLGKSYATISFGAVLCCSFLMIANIEISRLLFSKDFYEAWKFVPPLLIAALMNQLSLSCENLFIALKNTKIISITAMAAACVNTVLNFTLIPQFGIYGASIATVCGFGFQWLIRYIFLIKSIKLKNNIKKEAISYVLLFMQMGLAYFGNRYWIYQMLIFGGIIVLYKQEISIIFIRIIKKMESKKSS